LVSGQVTDQPLEVLRARGFVQDVTDLDALNAAFAAGPVTYYVGFDPTAPSLHAGNLVGMMAMAWLQRLGHRPIAIAGGATGRIGDPSGRDAERTLLDEQTVARHLDGIRRQLGTVLDFGGAGQGVAPHRHATDGALGGLLLDNQDWLGSLGFLEFLRDVGKHFSVNAMIARESVKRRLASRDQGISFTEFSYQLLQAYDFLHLYREYGCTLQAGGSDQWGNIVAGIDLIRRSTGAETFGLTWPLLTTADGAKFGKSAGNAIWLDAEQTSPYAYYQYWLNAADADVVRFLKLFTFLDLAEIEELGQQLDNDPAARVAHKVLAAEATRIIHGDEGVLAAERATSALFTGASQATTDDALSEVFADAPSVELDRQLLVAGIGVLDMMRLAGACKSNGEARRLVDQAAVRIDDRSITDPQDVVTQADLPERSTLVLKVGKKRVFLVRFVEDPEGA